MNVNEAGGALAWLGPILLGMVILLWRERPAEHSVWQEIRRWIMTLGFITFMTALFFGQSRFAIGGIVVAFAVQIALLLKDRARIIGYGLLGLFVLAEIVIISNILVPPELSTIERDQDSVSSRLLIWESAVDIIRDYPLTGVGINAFRAPGVRELYPVPGYEERVLPHAHNEFLQIGSDMGIPGILALGLLYATAAASLLKVWKRGRDIHKLIALSAACGLLAHLGFSVGDAIAWWDRLSFLFWLTLGLVFAAESAVKAETDSATRESDLTPGYTPQG